MLGSFRRCGSGWGIAGRGCDPRSDHRENPGKGDNYFVDVFRFLIDFEETEVHLQESETDEFKLATLEEIEQLGAAGKFLHYDSIKKGLLMV